MWNPEFCGDIDIRIGRDGTWYYMNSPIGRPALVKLFAGILRRDGGDYFLVTPVEKLGITVDDAPFTAVEFEVEGKGERQVLRFRTNVGDVVEAGPDHPIRVNIDPRTGEPAPYLMVRDRLEALITRAVFYDLVALGVERTPGNRTILGVFSGGSFFTIGELEPDVSERQE
ncbi:MAG: DUF1285 domain-containing protein [Sphingomonadales bacterium]